MVRAGRRRGDLLVAVAREVPLADADASDAPSQGGDWPDEVRAEEADRVVHGVTEASVKELAASIG